MRLDPPSRESCCSAATVQVVAMSSVVVLVMIIAPILVRAAGTPNSKATPAPAAAGSGYPPRYAVIDLGTNFIPVGINTNGIIAGNAPASYTNGAEVWSNGITTVLQPGTETTYGYETQATAISDSGTVVGSANFLYTNVTVSPNQVRGEGHGCAWTNTTTPPIDLDSASPSLPQHDETGPYAYYYSSYATGISSQGIVYGYYNSNDGNVDEPIQFGAAGSPPQYASASWDALAGTPTNNYSAGPGCSINSVGGTNWIGAYSLYTYSEGPFQSGYIVNGHLVADNFPGTGPLAFACFAGGINTNGVGVGSDPSGPTMIQNLAVTHLPGSGSANAINDAPMITAANPPTTNYGQIVGTDGSGNGTLWDYTDYNGTNTIAYVQKNLSELLSTNSSGGSWEVTAANGINDSGAIVGTANYTQIPYAPVAHGVLLLPCQFRLLNGSTNPTDVDGMDFSGNRPTTITATASYTTASFISTNLAANAGTNVIGVDTPLGYGRPDSPFANNSYVNSLVMLAKVSPPAATNIVYGWNRVVQGREVTIINTLSSTNSYWLVTGVTIQNGYPNPLEDHPSTNFETSTPSTNNNVVAIYDNPALYLAPCAGNGAGVGDYAYLKDAYTYSLTNTVGIANAVATQQVGVYYVAKRVNLTGNIAIDWIGITNVASTTNIPDCSGVTVSEIRSIVQGTEPIVLDPSVTNNN